MAHPIEIFRSNGAAHASAVFDAGVSGIYCVLRLAITVLGSPLPFAQIVALAVAGIAMTVMILPLADRGRHYLTPDGRLGNAPSDIQVCPRVQTRLR